MPLRSGYSPTETLRDREPVIDLQTLLNGIYDRAAYDLKLDYSIEPVPPLLEIDAAWVDALSQAQLIPEDIRQSLIN